MSPLVPAFLQGLWNLGGQYFKNKSEKAQVKHQKEMKLLSQDDAYANQSALSWKDEYWTIILSLPFVQLILAPPVEIAMNEEAYVNGQWTNAVVSGLESLSLVPEWYQYLFGIAVLASFGIKPTVKKARELMSKRK